MRIISSLSLCVILLLACAEPPEAHPDSFPPVGRDEVVTRSVEVISYTANKVEVELKMNLLYYYSYGLLCMDKAWGDYVLNYADELPASAFVFDAHNDEDYQTILKSVQRVTPITSNQAFSTLLLVDNTRDFPLTESDDPNFNRKFEALNYFFLNTPQPSNFALAAFGNNGKMGVDVKFAAGFNQDWQTYASEAIKLSEEEGGTNNIIEALDEAIDYVENNATNPQKSIVVITHSYPEFPLSEYKTVANKAASKGIAIHIIDMAFFLATDLFGYQELTRSTGGFYISASAHPNSGAYPILGYSSVMIQMNELLKRQYQEYVVRLEISYTGSDPNYFEPGFIYPHVIQLKYQGEDKTDCGTKYYLEEFEENMILYAFTL
jgi:von Willebrand factor type A domain